MEPKKNNTIGIIIVVLLIIGIAVFAMRNKDTTNPPPNNEPPIVDGTGNNPPTQTENIRVEMPTSGQVVTGSLRIKGEARGWFFEGSFPYKIVDDQGKTIVEAPIQAKGEWMTADYVDFDTTVQFYSSRPGGKLILMKDNPSGLPEHDESIEIPLIFLMGESMTVKAYFSNSVKDPNALNCNVTYPVERTIAKTQAVGEAALKELLKGVSRSEIQAGYDTSLNSGIKLNSLTIVDGVAKADFSRELDTAIGGSCRVSQIRSQIESTLKQFPTVKSVVISVNGDSTDILQP